MAETPENTKNKILNGIHTEEKAINVKNEDIYMYLSGGLVLLLHQLNNLVSSEHADGK